MSELTQRVKAKYPQYANVPDADLEKRVLQKYPQYKPYASKSIGGFVENIGKSGFNAVKDIGSAAINVLNPDLEKNTLANLAMLGVDTAKLVTGDQSELNRASQVLNFYKQRYGGVNNVGNTIYNDPVGFLLDASVILGGTGAVVKGVGTAGKIAGVTKAGTTLSRAGAAIDPFVQAGKFAKAGIKGAMSKGGANLERAGKNYAIRGYGQPKTIERFGKKYRPAQDVISEYGLYGKDTQKLADVIESLQGEFDNIARTSGRTVSVEEIMNATLAKIDELKQSGFDDDVLLAKQLEKKLESFIDANPESTVDIGKATEQRIGYDKRVKTFATDPVLKGANQQMRDIFQTQIRKSADGLTTPTGENLTQTGKRLSELYAFQPIMEQAATTGTTVRPLSVGKVLSAVAGGAAAGVPGAIAMYGADVIASNPKVMGATSKVAQKVGAGMQSAKLPSSKPVSKTYTFAKTANVFSRPTSQKTDVPKLKLVSQAKKVPVQPYKPIVPSPATPDPKKVKPLEYKQPKSVFSNKSAFGSTKKVQRGSFY